ncbi:maleylpyruvate isomerase N-terminal domain-containing protein [Nocardia sp. CA-135398]|uniref:maleylpyruvate isomerase N-terminal domain-containing protein n=1 Tax=Nocardia sp. CA-135398 TaxID=3239977 RepID=UPI003D965F92
MSKSPGRPAPSHLAEDADPTLPVPDCPGWKLGQLLRYVGGCHRWIETTVRTRADRLVAHRGRVVTQFANRLPPVCGARIVSAARHSATRIACTAGNCGGIVPSARGIVATGICSK